MQGLGECKLRLSSAGTSPKVCMIKPALTLARADLILLDEEQNPVSDEMRTRHCK